VLIVRAGKFGKSRELPLHRTSVEAISEYLERPDRPRPADPTGTALLLGDDGRRLSPNVANHVFHAVTITAGVSPRSARCRPRQHDLRHYVDGGVMRPSGLFPLVGALPAVILSA
jgi:site-specific recombinase XerC